MIRFEDMSSMEIDAFHQFAEALYEGRIRPPKGVKVGESVEETIRQMLDLYLLFRVVDYNSTLEVFNAIQAADVRLVQMAMDYIGNPKLN